jgi:hypothetical protein
VHEVPWKVPTIDETHFTVEAFQKVVHQTGMRGVEWAWIEIACIDQENDSIKMHEIVKQASIFRKATNAFVWLSHLSTDALIAAVGVLESKGPELWVIDSDELDITLVEDIRQALETIFERPVVFIFVDASRNGHERRRPDFERYSRPGTSHFGIPSSYDHIDQQLYEHPSTARKILEGAGKF